MVLKGSVTVLFLLLTGEFALSQSISNEVLVPAAAVVKKGNISFSQTIGEPVVEIISADNKVLTQGFQQKRILEVIDKNYYGTGVKSYPNPVNEYVKVEVWSDVARELRISVINFQGVLLYDAERNYSDPYQDIIEIDVSDFKRGMYFIRVTSIDKALFRVFKFEKL